MAKEETKIKHHKTFNSDQKVTDDRSWVIMSDGSRFKRTVLPFADGECLERVEIR